MWFWINTQRNFSRIFNFSIIVESIFLLRVLLGPFRSVLLWCILVLRKFCKAVSECSKIYPISNQNACHSKFWGPWDVIIIIVKEEHRVIGDPSLWMNSLKMLSFVLPGVKYFLNNQKEYLNLVNTLIWLQSFAVKECVNISSAKFNTGTLNDFKDNHIHRVFFSYCPAIYSLYHDISPIWLFCFGTNLTSPSSFLLGFGLQE